MNEIKLCNDLDALMHFIDDSLGIDRDKNSINGFVLTVPLTEAAAYNSYLETISNKTDTIYLKAKEGLAEMTKHSYLNYISRIARRFDWKSKTFVLAFDYTDEDFYGDVQGIDIYGWTGEKGVTGKFKFLTCSLVSDEIPQKIPLISIPVQLGHSMSYAVTHCMSLVMPHIGTIDLVLFDRWFYSKALMYDLKKLKIPYLIFVPKDVFIKRELNGMREKEKKVIEHEYTLNRDKSNYTFASRLAFLKQVYNGRLDKHLDWVFATNVDDIGLDTIIETYRKRWRIETQFRVQDEASIKCKSKEMKVRYFLFLFEQLLQTLWVCYHKEVPFKEFIIALAKMSRKWTKT
jgi:hypothetical protein